MQKRCGECCCGGAKLTDVLTTIRAGLSREGMAICSVEIGTVVGLLSEIGTIVEQTRVRQIKGATTYLSGHDAVPLHTDHPEARWVAWWCETQAERDGASLLADGHAVLSLMGEQADALAEVEQHVPPQLPGQTLVTSPVRHGKRLYYAPWYPVVRTTKAGDQALTIFRSLLAMGVGCKRIRLHPGNLLVVDNGRWLHGRDKLEMDNRRFLQRYWLQ